MLQKYPKLRPMVTQLLERSHVQAGFIHHFDEEFQILLQLKGSYLSNRMKNC
jgi:hypothetical protein